MRFRLLVRLAVPAALPLGVVAALAYDGNPPESTTGAPAVGGASAEGSCIDCHDSFALNQGGAVTLLNPPFYYRPGATYTLTLQLASSQTAGDPDHAWGFQLTPVNPANGAGAGTLANVTGQGTTIAAGSGGFSTRRYIDVGTSNHAAEASPATWQFRWTAPSPGIGAIEFHFSGVAANGGQGTNGDWVYHGSYAMQDTTTPVLPVSWGQVKQRYRE